MLYVGHFSFDELRGDGPRHGYFTMLARAESAEAVLEKFRGRIRHLKDNDTLFDPVRAIYVEDVVEIREFPADPVITRFQSSEGEFPRSRSQPLPAAEPAGVSVYGLAAEGAPNDDEDGYPEVRPFMIFEG
jgi:hypothetical protein